MMYRLFTANVENDEDVARVCWTGLNSSNNETIYLMSNGKWVQIAHKEFREELENDGFWLCAIFEHGHRVEA